MCPLLVVSAEAKAEVRQPLDLRQVTVLPRSEWLRLQDSLNQVDKHKEFLIEAAKQREAMHLRSKEVVKNWTNTIAVSNLKTVFFYYYYYFLMKCDLSSFLYLNYVLLHIQQHMYSGEKYPNNVVLSYIYRANGKKSWRRRK